MVGPRSRVMFTQSMFFKLLISFLFIIFILSSFHIITYNFSIRNLEEEIVLNASERLQNIVNKADSDIMKLRNMLLRISQEHFFTSIATGRNTKPTTQKSIIDAYRIYETNPDYNVSCVHTVFIFTKRVSDKIMTFESTYYKNTFFQLFYSNPIYNELFWEKEIGDHFTFRIYPMGTFVDRSNYVYKNDVPRDLMPIAVKANNNYNYVMVALVDIEELLYSIDENFADDLSIVNGDGKLLYSSIDNREEIDFTQYNSSGYIKDRDGYLFINQSVNSGLLYCKRISRVDMKSQLNKINLTFRLIAGLSILIGILISIYLVKRFNNPVRQIVSMLERDSDPDRTNINAVNFSYLQDSIKVILNENSTFHQKLKQQRSILEQLSYQAGIKNIYPDVKNYIEIENKYFVLFCRVHFKSYYYDTINIDPEMAIYYLIEIIQFYVSSQFGDSVTFQIESDAIVSVVNVNDEELGFIEQGIDMVMEKLKNEEEYLFFTIVYSEVYSEISQLSDAYKSVTEIEEYRKPLPIVQLLSIDRLDMSYNKFYFTLEQEEKLFNLLYSGDSQGSIELVVDILDYNMSRDVNWLYMQALCHEIANCCTKVLIKGYYDIPRSIESANIYFHIRNCATIDCFKEVLENYIFSVTFYIQHNKREYDYIIDSITNYVKDCYAEDIYLDLLAERLDLTSNYISSYFKDKMGMGLNDYINHFRIRKSMEFLESTSDKVKDISTSVGFSNINTFNRAFKRYTGETPTEYRRRLMEI